MAQTLNENDTQSKIDEKWQTIIKSLERSN